MGGSSGVPVPRAGSAVFDIFDPANKNNLALRSIEAVHDPLVRLASVSKLPSLRDISAPP